MEIIKNQKKIPEHLKKYIVDQNYNLYTAEDQAVWRYIMRRLTEFFSQHAHPCYLEGLERSGISVESIPHIQQMDEKLSELGWGAVPVSGFIPPAAFMEFQSLGILPIACNMRTLDHLLYTPAPDIVHEAAGHAPMLVDPSYARYLKKYAEMASKAIISQEDIAQYEAIRLLSDTKENPESHSSDIAQAMEQLEKANQSISYVSEAAFLGRMNWWTAEYGLIGSLKKPKIFGAGLLSSVGESLSCLEKKVNKIPFTIHCLDYAYDITEPQPQLFVTPSFEALEQVLRDLGHRMAYKQGGLVGLEKAWKAKTVNTVELNSGLQISGLLDSYRSGQVAGLTEPIFLHFKGPTQLCLRRQQLDGHGSEYHAQGFGSPVGLLRNETKCLSFMDSQDLQRLRIIQDSKTSLLYASGIKLEGTVEKITRGNGKIILISFRHCTVTLGSEILFHPDWGTFDLAVGSFIPSVFGGPADRTQYENINDFLAQRVPVKKYSTSQLKLFSFYDEIKKLRNKKEAHQKEKVEALINIYHQPFATQWLAGLELIEICAKWQWREEEENLKRTLLSNQHFPPHVKACIEEGLRLCRKNP